MEAILTMDSNNGLPKIGMKSSKDLNFFNEKTKKNVVIMGRNAYLSLSENDIHLKDRLNIVLTSHPDIFLNEPSSIPKKNEVIFTNNSNIHSAILNNRERMYKLYPVLSRNFKIFFIGGKQIYDQYIPLCDVVWVTRCKNRYSRELTFDYDLEKQFKEIEYGEDDDIKISKYKKL
jgi:dihydrofolate reductase